MKNSNIKKLKKHLIELLSNEEYEGKKFFAYDNYYNEKEAKEASKFAIFKYSKYVKNLPLTGNSLSSKEIIDLVCNYIKDWSDWEFTEVGTLKNMIIINLKNSHKIEIIPSSDNVVLKQKF